MADLNSRIANLKQVEEEARSILQGGSGSMTKEEIEKVRRILYGAKIERLELQLKIIDPNIRVRRIRPDPLKNNMEELQKAKTRDVVQKLKHV